MDIQFDGTSTKKDFLAFYRLVNSPLAGNDLLRLDAWLIWLMLGIFLLATAAAELWVAGVVTGAATFGVLGLFALWSAARLHPAAMWNSSTLMRMRVQGRISEDGIQYLQQATGHVRKWDSFHGYGVYGDVIGLVLDARNNLTPFYRSFFKTDADWLAFKDLVARQLPETHRVTAPRLALALRILIFALPLAIGVYLIATNSLFTGR